MTALPWGEMRKNEIPPVNSILGHDEPVSQRIRVFGMTDHGSDDMSGLRLARLNKTIGAQMARWHVPGLVIGILHEDAMETGAYGIANVATGAAATPETLFQIGSISKIFTTTLALALADDGLLDIDRPVISYVPDLPLADVEARQTVTIRHLVTHMSGFYGDRFDDRGRGDDAIARAVAAFGDLPQQTRPGELWTYCNAGFDLTGRAIELAGGAGFETQMRARVFEPLGLHRATYFADEAILHAVAAGHSGGDKTPHEIARPWPIPRRSNPAGGISATVGELLRFAKMHMQDGELDGARVLKPETARAMRAYETDADPFRSWGLGWSRREVGGELLIEHNGATNGQTARLTMVPSRRFAITILTNHGSGGAAHTAISEAALEQLLGIVETRPSPVDYAEHALQRWAGTYSHQLGDVTLAVKDGGFDVSRVHRNPFSGEQTAGEPFRLTPVGERVMLASGGGTDGSYADIILNPDGGVRFFRMGGRLGYPVDVAGGTTL